MKTKSFVLCLVTLLVGLATGVAADERGTARQKGKSAATSRDSSSVQTETVQLTGSYIKRTVKRNGRITDGPSPVIVIDRTTIERSGARDLKQLLVGQGVGR